MNKYDYIKAVCHDINDWLLERYTINELIAGDVDEFCDQRIMLRSPETQDVIIRCMLVPYCYDAVIEAYETMSPIDYYGIEQMLGV